MKITAIICEYNPMTNGHLKHIRLAKQETGCDTLVGIMSGSFVQRGDAAVADKYVRASVAVKLGVDMIVELPTLYAVSAADNFAYGAVKTLSAFPDVEYLSFGSECGNASLLTKLAAFLREEPPELKSLLRAHLDRGYSFPKARAMAVDALADNNPEYADIKGLLDSPNNVLGVAYINAIAKANLPVKIHTIKREGNYNDEDADGDFPSSTAVRKAARRGELAKLRDQIPPEVYAYLLQRQQNDASLSDMILFKLKTMSGYDLEKYYDVSGGIHNKLKLCAANASTLEQLLEAAKTKNYTMARLKRLCLYALFDITQDMYNESLNTPAYVQILAVHKDRKDILSALSQTCRNVLTRYSDVSRADKSIRYLVKLDFTAQGTLGIINRCDTYTKKMLFVERD